MTSRSENVPLVPDVSAELAGILAESCSRQTLRQAAAIAGIDERTAVRVALGWRVHNGSRDRLLAALAQLGVDVSAIPTLETGRVGGEVAVGASTALPSGNRGAP